MVPHNSTAASGGTPSREQGLERAEAVRLVMQFTLSRAADLARAGAYPEAEALLRSVDPAELPIAGLDLLARICVQQGRFEEAKRWWQEVLSREPENQPARSALERLAQEECARKTKPVSRRRWWERVPKRWRSPGLPDELNIHVPEVVVRPEASNILLTFEVPLFEDSQAVLTEKGKKTLARLGWQLEPYVGKITIEIIGQPDRLPDSLEGLPSDVSALGMARAFAVFHHLIQTTKLQSRMFSLRTGDDFLAWPASDTSAGERPAGQPVILRVGFLH